MNQRDGLNMTASGIVLPAGFEPVGAANTVSVSNGAGGIVWEQIGDAQVAASAAIQLSKLETDPRDNGHIVAHAQANYATGTGGTSFGPDPATAAANCIGFTSTYLSTGLTGTPQLRLYIALRITAYGVAGQVVNVVGNLFRYPVAGGGGGVLVIGPTTLQITNGVNPVNLYQSVSAWVDVPAEGDLYQTTIQINWTGGTRPTGTAYVTGVHRMRG